MPPKSAYKPIKRKCIICDKTFKDKASLIDHIAKVHKDSIPEDYSPARYENYLRTGMTHGNCVECKNETNWNETTWKYNRLCDNPKCREIASTKAKNNMISKYGKEHLLDDPEMQRKMIYSKRNSGTYYWTTDDNKKYKIMYASSEEKKFLEMLDVFLNMEPEDVLGPSPNTYPYKYNGEDHFYIPDYYIPSINLEIEIKEPKDNQNMHPKIQAVDKVKEDIKDKMMKTHHDVNYIKINGSDYKEFFILVMQLKEKDDSYKMSEVYKDIHESINNQLSNTMNSILENKLTPNISDNLNIVKNLYNPGLTYKDDIKRFDNMISRAKTNFDLDMIEGMIDNYNDTLQLMIKNVNNQSKYESTNRENYYEAKKALNKISSLKAKINKKRSYINESTTYMKEAVDYSTFYTEGTIFKGYNIKRNVWYKPVFIVLSRTHTSASDIIHFVTRQQYTHAGLSFDSTMNHIMSFNMDSGGISGGYSSRESFKYGGYSNSGATYAIYMYLAPEPEYRAMVNFIEDMDAHRDDYKYSFKGLFNYLIGRNKEYDDQHFCSEFVATVIRHGNPKLIENPTNSYAPGDLAGVKKFVLIDKGLIESYNLHKVDIKVKNIMKEKGLQSVVVK